MASAVPERDELNSRGNAPDSERVRPHPERVADLNRICATLSGSRLLTRFPGALPPAIT
jgi:hypothetical protein